MATQRVLLSVLSYLAMVLIDSMKQNLALIVTLYIFSFMLHFIWEMWQIPFYLDMLAAEHWSAVVSCSQATFGDGVIALIAYIGAALWQRNLFWLNSPTIIDYSIYLSVGLLITVVFEYFAVDVLNRWQYSEAMPVLPLLGTGVTPLLQWLVIPPVVLWASRIFIKGLKLSNENSV